MSTQQLESIIVSTLVQSREHVGTADNLLAAARIECVYCNCDVVDRTDESVPSVSDDQAWGDLAKDHGGNCEWIKTRAHQI